MSGSSDSGHKDTTVERALSSLSKAAAVLASVVCLCFAVSLLSSVAGYAIYGWLGALTGLGTAWAIIGLGFAVASRTSTSRSYPPPVPVVVPQVAIAQPMMAVPQPPPMTQDSCNHEDDEDYEPGSSSRITLPLAALALGAAAVVGPVRALRMGLKLYTVWSGISRVMSQTDMSHPPRGGR